MLFSYCACEPTPAQLTTCAVSRSVKAWLLRTATVTSTGSTVAVFGVTVSFRCSAMLPQLAPVLVPIPLSSIGLNVASAESGLGSSRTAHAWEAGLNLSHTSVQLARYSLFIRAFTCYYNLVASWQKASVVNTCEKLTG